MKVLGGSFLLAGVVANLLIGLCTGEILIMLGAAWAGMCMAAGLEELYK